MLNDIHVKSEYVKHYTQSTIKTTDMNIQVSLGK